MSTRAAVKPLGWFAAVVFATLALVPLACPSSQVMPPPNDGGVPPVDAGVPLPEVVADPSIPSGCMPAAPGAGTARAKRVECDGELPEGPLAMGRVGDVLLENARVRFVLRDGPESAVTIGAPGGTVVDAIPQTGSRVDGLKEVLPLLNFHGLVAERLVIVRASGTEAIVRTNFTTRAIGLIAATLPATFTRPRVRGVLEYSLRADDAFVRMRVCAVTESGMGSVPTQMTAYVQLGGSYEVIAPGSGVLEGEMGNAIAPALLGENAHQAIGFAPEGDTATVLHVNSSNFVQATNPTPFEGMSARCGVIRIAVGPTEADVAPALAVNPPTMMNVARVPPGGRAEFATADGRIVLRSRETAGMVQARLEPGMYAVRVARAGGQFGDASNPPAVGTLIVRPTVQGEPGAPVRITLAGLDGLAVDTRFVAATEARRPVPAGRYRVSASRGTEYTLSTADVTVPPDGDVTFAPDLTRVVQTPGYVASDFHLHTELSTDSSHVLEDAVTQMAGEGLELLASTDHDFVSDFASVIARTSAAGWVVAVAGEEVSTTRLGHFGGYPLRRDVARAGAGAVPWFGLAPNDLFAAIRERGTDVLVQVNHPRNTSSFFHAIDFDPATLRARRDPAALGLPAGTVLDGFGFDVIEVWNGYTRGGNESAFADFLALRASGRNFAMVGNSDSHRPDRPPGAPRTYVRVPDDARGRYDWAAVSAGIRARDVSVSAGLYAEMNGLDGTRPGGTLRATAGRVTVHVRVQGPPWADCTRVRLYRGTQVVFDERVTTARSERIRFERDLAVDVTAPTILTFRADGEADADPVFPWPPLAVVNPIAVMP